MNFNDLNWQPPISYNKPNPEALKALEQEQERQERRAMTREEAIQILDTIPTIGEQVDALEMAIEVLERQTCDYCKYSEETDGMTCYECVKGISDNFEALEQEPSEDCISREWVLNLYKEWQPTLATNVLEFGDALNNAPSVEPSRPQGHYIKGENGEWYCSNCKRIDDKYSVAKFCWYCGARMESDEE